MDTLVFLVLVLVLACAMWVTSHRLIDGFLPGLPLWRPILAVLLRAASVLLGGWWALHLVPGFVATLP